VAAARRCAVPPWVVFASSREVYGEPTTFPVVEDAPLEPLNVYGRSKAAAERIVVRAQALGIRTAVVRLSNVYGRTCDHADRVVPAFARGAAVGGHLRVDGASHTFDFTHLDDTVRGIAAVVEWLEHERGSLPPIQFVTGRATTLGQLASMAIELGGGRGSVTQGTERRYDVARFCGSYARARSLLGWEPQVAIRDGLRALIEDFRSEAVGQRHDDGVA
jgi:nucleoside-diphosphate-sugar epimerase